jgi:hypothetical protein
MRAKPVAKALRNSVLKGAAGNRPAAAMARGVEAAGMVSASASEFLRVRRDPAEVAYRRRRAAVRRTNIWGAGSAVGVAAGAAVTVGVVHDGLTASTAFSLVLIVALLIWCLIGLVRSVVELRARSRAVALIPPPQPARRPVAAPIRAEIARLDAFSDGLRQLLSMLPGDRDVPSLPIRRDVIGAADDAEQLLRQQAQEYTGIRKTTAGAPPDAVPALTRTADALAQRITTGVEQYGRLVAAATATVAASSELTVAATDLEGPTERLEALALGMREIARYARPGGPDPAPAD